MARTLLTVTAFLAAVVPAAYPQEDYVDSAGLHQAGLVKFWQLQLPLKPEERVRDAYRVDELLYLGTNQGYVFAVDAYTGIIRWAQQYTRGGYAMMRPAHAGIRTIIATPPEMVQFDRQFGTPIRLQELRFPAGAPPVTDGRLIFLGGVDRRMYAFALDQNFETWKAGADAPLTSRPALSGRYLFYASEGGTIYACVAATKRLHWIARNVGPVTADLAVDENGVYVASRDRSLYLLDPAFGAQRWRARLSSPLEEPPVLTSDVVYQFSPADGLVAINTAGLGVEDRIRWEFSRGRSLLTVDERFAYVLTADQRLAVLDKDSGELRHDIAAAGFTMPIPTPEEAALFIADEAGRILCARKRGVPLLRPEDLRRSLTLREQGSEQEPAAESAGEPEVEVGDLLESKGTGPPVGGKSKISREWGRGGG